MREEDAVLRDVRERRPHLLAVDDVLVAVAHRSVVRPARSLPAPGSLKSWHQSSEPSRIPGRYSLLLLVGTGDEQRRPRPADPDRVQRPRDVQVSQDFVDRELFDRGGFESPRLGPVRRHVTGFGEAAVPVGGEDSTGRVVGDEGTGGGGCCLLVIRRLRGHGREATSSVPAIRSEPDGGGIPHEWARRRPGPHGRTRGRGRAVVEPAVCERDVELSARDDGVVPFGVYVHIPFCAHRCDYCDFATWTDREHLIDAYVDACVA